MTEVQNRPGDVITGPAQEAQVSAGATGNDTVVNANLTPVNKLTFAELLGVLGYGDDRREHAVICYRFGADGHFTHEVKASEDAAPFVDTFFASTKHKRPNVWFGINPMPADVKGRGTAKDVMRLGALFADLDVKPGACPDLDTAHAIIDDLSEVLGQRPVAVIHSGHGLQPIWAVERASADSLKYPDAAAKLLQRFRHVVEFVAACHGCDVDNVFDLPRILRVPDTINWKDAEHPAPTWCEADTGKPVTVEGIVQALDDFGAPAPEERPGFGAGGQGPQAFSRGALVARVAKAPEGQRNRTLFGAAKDAARQGDLDTDMAEKLADAAQGAGLDSGEIDGTIYSAAQSEDVDIIEAPARPAGGKGHADGERENGLDLVEGMPRLWNATDLRGMEQPRWLAKNRLPRAAVSLLVGDEGIGKSLLWVWIAAAVTTGRPLIEFGVPQRDPGHVIVIATEDDWSTTVLPRLQVAGADLSMVRVICTEEDGSGAPVFPRDLYLITEADPVPALIVVDAWLDTVPTNLKVKDPQQARQALHPWREVATVTDAAVLLLTHTNRVNSDQAREKYGATGELRKKARMTLFAQLDAHGNLVVGPEKANGAAPVPASTFGIKGVRFFPPTEDHDGTVPLLGYLSESFQTAREHITSTYEASHGASSSADDVVAWLASYLAEGPRWATDVYDATIEAGFSKDKAKRAKVRLNVKAERETSTGPWYWCLPQHSGSAPREQEESV